MKLNLSQVPYLYCSSILDHYLVSVYKLPFFIFVMPEVSNRASRNC